MRASIVVPSYRGASRLATLLPALSAQTNPDFEAIIVIDGEVDDSTSVVRRHGDDRISPLVLPTNLGRVGALNAGFSRARGDVLVRCDDDLEPGPGWLEAHIERCASSAGLIGVIGRYRNVYPQGSHYARVYGAHADLDTYEQLGRLPPERLWRAWAGNVSMSRGVWQVVGPYDERYRAYGWEDVDYGYRMWRAGIPLVLVPEADAPHRAAGSDTIGRSLRAYQSASSRRIFEAIHGHGSSGPRPDPRGAWGHLLRLVAVAQTEASIASTARLTERTLPLTPDWLGRKLVALNVESAALAGARHHDDHTAKI